MTDPWGHARYIYLLTNLPLKSTIHVSHTWILWESNEVKFLLVFQFLVGFVEVSNGNNMTLSLFVLFI